MSKLKAFADDNLDVYQKLKFTLGGVGNIVGKGENTHNVFKRLLSEGRVPRGSVVKCLTRNPGVLGLSRTRSSGFFVGVSLGMTLHSLA